MLKFKEVNISEFEYLQKKDCWESKYNIKTNADLNKYVFGENIKLKNDIYAFTWLSDIGVSLKPNQHSWVLAYENKNNKMTWLVTNFDGAVEIMTTKGLNHIHELILSEPIKGFLDIEFFPKGEDMKKVFSQNIDKNEKSVDSFIEVFKEEYDKRLGKLLNFDFTKQEDRWLIEDATKETKVSKHVKFNHIKNGALVMFENVDHAISILKNIVDELRLKYMVVFSIDFCFHRKKPLRMCYSSHQKEPERILYPKSVGKTFDAEVFRKSAIMLNPYMKIDKFIIISDPSIAQKTISQDEVITIIDSKEGTRKAPNSKLTLTKKTQNEPSIKIHDAKPYAETFVKKLLIMLKNVGNLNINGKIYKFDDFTEDTYKVYMVKMNSTCIFIDLDGLKCPINFDKMNSKQRILHTHGKGRRFHLAFQNHKLYMWCAGCKGSGAQHYLGPIRIGEDVNVSKRFGVYDAMKSLIEICLKEFKS